MAGRLTHQAGPHCCNHLSGTARQISRSSTSAAWHSRAPCVLRDSTVDQRSSRSCGRRHAAVQSSRATPPVAQQQQQSQREDRSAGRATYRPESFQVVIDDASAAVLAGLEDGLTRMEVELPSVGVDSECVYIEERSICIDGADAFRTPSTDSAHRVNVHALRLQRRVRHVHRHKRPAGNCRRTAGACNSENGHEMRCLTPTAANCLPQGQMLLLLPGRSANRARRCTLWFRMQPSSSALTNCKWICLSSETLQR